MHYSCSLYNLGGQTAQEEKVDDQTEVIAKMDQVLDIGAEIEEDQAQLILEQYEQRRFEKQEDLKKFADPEMSGEDIAALMAEMRAKAAAFTAKMEEAEKK